MGLRPKELIEHAATHLLSILKIQGSVLYSSFCDGSEEFNHRLCAGIGISPKDGVWYSAEGLMDNAVAQLERQEVVTIEWLESQLCDGEPDYRITLTEYGPTVLDSGARHLFFESE